MKTFEHIDGAQSYSDLRSAISSVAQEMGEAPFRQQVSRVLGEALDADRIIPDKYRSYRPIVHDGIVFFFSKLPLTRLVDMAANQIHNNGHTTPEERMFEIARKVPTLHKLGQIIARNRHVDPLVRAWLVKLENGNYGTDAGALCRVIEEGLGEDMRRFSVTLDRRILSEASVGGVVPFRWIEPDTHLEKEGVFKVLKPMVAERLEEELTALAHLADFFEENRGRYCFGRFRFKELVEDVSTALREEVDLTGEQKNLHLARQFYTRDKTVCVPEPAPFSSSRYTAMSRMSGAKVTDVPGRRDDRKEAAVKIFRAVICAPLFSNQDAPLFHGDPHAGNIFSEVCETTGRVRVALLDWSQTGRLAKTWRISILKMVQGVLRNDVTTIRRALGALSLENADRDLDGRIRKAVTDTIRLEEYGSATMMKRVFVLLEQAAICGIRFPKDLLLFRKTFFTLDGLLADLDPEFDMAHVVMCYVRDLLVGELPKRAAAFFSIIEDSSEQYRSMLSNKDLQMLLISHGIDLVRKNADMIRGFVEKNQTLLMGLSTLPTFFISRFAKILLGLYFLYRNEFSQAQDMEMPWVMKSS